MKLVAHTLRRVLDVILVDDVGGCASVLLGTLDLTGHLVVVPVEGLSKDRVRDGVQLGHEVRCKKT